LLGKALAVFVNLETPVEEVHKPRTVACIGKVFDAPSELLAQLLAARIRQAVLGSLEIVT
jgi:hypothetical protein